MENSWWRRLFPLTRRRSYLRDVVTGCIYRISDARSNNDIADIRTQIQTMRALARDSQISTALSYYATDATVTNTSGQIIWAVPTEKKYTEVAEIINENFRRWNINEYARDHILELATIGNLYIPTTEMYKENADSISGVNRVALDNNTIPDSNFDIVPSYKILPENILHIYQEGRPLGYIYQPDDKDTSSYTAAIYPESACIHFALGGLLGDYQISAKDSEGNLVDYDIKFAQPLMEKAVQPTQTLNLLEDAIVLSSLTRVIRFINVECGDISDDEIRNQLQQMKDAVEQNLSINTSVGDVQSFVNPESPNNFIYVPMFNGQNTVSVTDLNVAETTDTDSKLLEYYQDKKLSVLGVPKEAMNFSSNEGLGGAGAVLSQRSALYANSLQRLENAYMAGWKDAIDKYFIARNLSGFVGKYTLQMQPIVTTMSTILSERRDSAITQANSFVDLLKSLGVEDEAVYQRGIEEIMKEVLPQIGSSAITWNVNLAGGENSDF